jgi:superfamily II DNA/RNA helicase
VLTMDLYLIFELLYSGHVHLLLQTLWNLGFHVDTLHGDMDQNARTRIINDFKHGKLRVLVATDVAARGEFGAAL